MRLGIFFTHPIQYFAPMWRLLSAHPGMDVVVHFFSDHSVRGAIDPGFGREVKWDIPLLDGFQSVFITRDADIERRSSVRMPDPRKIFDEGRFDAIMIHGYMHGFERQVVREAKRRGLPVIMRGEFTDQTPYPPRNIVKQLTREIYLRWFYPHIGAFCYVGQRAKQHLQRLGVTPDRLFFSPYSVDSQLFESQRQKFDRATVRRELGIEPNQVAILFSGKFLPRKNPLLLVQACRELANTERIHLVMLGDGELHAKTRREAEELLGKRAHFPGFVNQSQIGRYFLAADLFVLPSIFETWGLVVNEAMEFGLPVVVSDGVGCAVDLVEPGVTGAVFRGGDSQDLLRAMRPFIEDTGLRTRSGQAARSKIAGYSVEASVAGILRSLGAL